MDVLADRYELGEPLGIGGMSRVIAAHDRALDRPVAVKLLRDDLAADPLVRKRLLREARAGSAFSHPNAVAVLDVGEGEAGRPFIVMERVEGRTLAAELRTRGSLPVAEAVRIADAILAALEAAHARGLVHRDVKPANILLAADGTAKLADFGIAKGLQEVAERLTATGQVLGTPRYLAPEQAAGRGATPRSDLYSLGVVLYEMLAGAPPFTAENPVALAMAHQRDPVPPLVERRPGVPPGLAAVVHRALEKDPSRRFATAAEMRAALQDPSDAPWVPPTQPVGAAEETATLRPTRRRAWWPAAAIAALLLGGAGLLALMAGDDPAPSPEVVGGDDPPADPAPADDDAGADEPDAAEPAEGSAPPSDPAQGGFEQVLEELRQNPEGAGDRADNLASGILDVLGEDPAGRAEEARRLQDDIDKWVGEGRLDPELGQRVSALLDDLAG